MPILLVTLYIKLLRMVVLSLVNQYLLSLLYYISMFSFVGPVIMINGVSYYYYYYGDTASSIGGIEIEQSWSSKSIERYAYHNLVDHTAWFIQEIKNYPITISGKKRRVIFW